ncbi:glycosyltransferase [Planococcus shixiaomingii]|uniref:glycosyltransferase n=1 Tax=Planococcus shixiaomingii TaxID=3058393 RepID=UPI0026323967|nr:glycosyltransferase [Planococcus sp. N022]WKA54000.1 glycosyltransferase [Planococcus sp. N022]
MKDFLYDLDIAFVGGVFIEDDIVNHSKGNMQFAANALQWNIIEGLDELNKTPVRLTNAMFIGSFPKFFKTAIIRKKYWHHTDGAKDVNVAFLNIPIYKKFSRAKNLSYEIKKWAEEDTSKKKILIGYSMDYSVMKALKEAKIKNKEIKTCLIVPDLPQFMNLENKTSFLYSSLKNIEVVLIRKLEKYIDSFVLLTDYMAKSLKIEDKPYTVVEGMVKKNQNIILNNVVNQAETKIILYTGTLNKQYGILELLNAFSQIEKPNYILQICGAGEAEKEIREIVKRDRRIDFKGRISREEALNLQKKATLLINPRNDTGEFTKFSFPSKILEYLSSGTPTIAFKLPGIPEEYDKYLNYIETNDIESIGSKIVEMAEKPLKELQEIGENGKRFVLDKKNNIEQTKKILNLINSTF